MLIAGYVYSSFRWVFWVVSGKAHWYYVLTLFFSILSVKKLVHLAYAQLPNSKIRGSTVCYYVSNLFMKHVFICWLLGRDCHMPSWPLSFATLKFWVWVKLLEKKNFLSLMKKRIAVPSQIFCMHNWVRNWMKFIVTIPWCAWVNHHSLILCMSMLKLMFHQHHQSLIPSIRGWKHVLMLERSN